MESIAQRVNYTLTSSGDSSEVGFIYGFGIFSQEELTSFNSMIRKITITTAEKECDITGKHLYEYLPNKRRGLLNNWIKIRIVNCPQHSAE
jgi:hypothetical protein